MWETSLLPGKSGALISVVAAAFVGAPPPSSSMAPCGWLTNFMTGSGTAKVSTPFRVWTLSWVELVLTLVTVKEEAHLAYLSQSEYPAKGSTVGGRTDDPGRQHTRTSAACHTPQPRAGQCQCRLPGGQDLPDSVLSLAEAVRALRARRGRPSPLSPQIEQLVIDLALGWGTWGCARLAAHLARRHGVQLAPSTIQRLLRRMWRRPRSSAGWPDYQV